MTGKKKRTKKRKKPKTWRHTSKRTPTKEGLEYVKWVMATTTTHSFLEGILTILIIYLPLLRVTQHLIGLGQLLKLQKEMGNSSFKVRNKIPIEAVNIKNQQGYPQPTKRNCKNEELAPPKCCHHPHKQQKQKLAMIFLQLYYVITSIITAKKANQHPNLR